MKVVLDSRRGLVERSEHRQKRRCDILRGIHLLRGVGRGRWCERVKTCGEEKRCREYRSPSGQSIPVSFSRSRCVTRVCACMTSITIRRAFLGESDEV